ncbi:sigma-70 family RNA polymerase sigma factor [Paenibacillus harenae]|uniref:sigma-70 family RNA polymerase sigma factor n=1 Tax=Paenibacillus harenae TaxID=306543 RepID=UPI00042A370D|nr:sigma-70 family RNA polymerase sigma factor [Paenibacillus harenae]
MTFPAEKEYLIHENIGIVKKLAGKMARNIRDSAIDFDDLMQSGSMGLMHAAMNYVPNEKTKFSSYAHHCVNGYMIRQINRISPIYVPVNIKHLAGRIVKHGLQGETAEVVSNLLEAPLDTTQKAMHYLSYRVVSAEKANKTNRGSMTSDEELTLMNMFSVEDDHSSMFLDDFLKYLKPQQKDVLYYLMKDLSLREIAGAYGISYQRVGQIKKEIEKRYAFYKSREEWHERP